MSDITSAVNFNIYYRGKTYKSYDDTDGVVNLRLYATLCGADSTPHGKKNKDLLFVYTTSNFRKLHIKNLIINNPRTGHFFKEIIYHLKMK